MLLLPSLLPTCYPHSSTILPTSPFFGEKCTLSHSLEKKQNSNIHPHCKVGDIQLLLIKTFSFISLSGISDLSLRKILMRVVVLLTVMILKRVSESIFFQSKRFTVCKVKDDKEVTNLNLLHNSSNIFLITVNGNLHLKFGHLSNFLLRR